MSTTTPTPPAAVPATSHWMLTATGRLVDLAHAPDQDAISILDIAHHLAQLNRYTGACSRPYSVAEHSLLVVEIMRRQMHVVSPSMLMAGLLHDAHEAYIADVSSPAKSAMAHDGCTGYLGLEMRMAYAVQKRFNVITVSTSCREFVRWADLTALSTERAQLMPATGPEWACTRSHPPVTWWKAEDAASWTWQDWRQAYLDCFAELTTEREIWSLEQQGARSGLEAA